MNKKTSRKPSSTFNIHDSLNQQEQDLIGRVFNQVNVKLDQIRIHLNHATLRSRRHAEEVIRQIRLVKGMLGYLEDDLLQLRLYDEPPEYVAGMSYSELWRRFFREGTAELPLDRYDTELRWFAKRDLQDMLTSSGRDRDALDKVWNEIGRQGNQEHTLWARIDRKVQRYLKQFDRELRDRATEKGA